MGDLSTHFSRSELQCPCCHRMELAPGFLENIENVRNLYGDEMVIDSGFRCEVHNRLIVGNPRSAHLKGNAIDVKILASTQRFRLIKAAIDANAWGIGVYNNWVHIDFEPRAFGRCTWVGK